MVNSILSRPYLIQLYLIALLHFISCEEGTIKFAFEIFRHGARAPFTGVVDGKDCYGYPWPGTSELSDVGKRMHYLLGAHNRKRYVGTLLSESYNQSEIYVISTDVNRTLESVSSQLQGLYPSGTGPKIVEKVKETARPPNQKYITKIQEAEASLDLNALPNQIDLIPIHTFDLQKHTFQLHDWHLCPGAAKAYEQSMNRQEIKDFMKNLTEKYGDKLIKFEKDQTNKTFLYDYWTTYKYMDAFIANYVNGETMQPLLDLGINLEEFKEYSLQFLNLDYLGTNFNNKNLAIVSMTHTMRNIITYMENIINTNSSVHYKPKFVMYSAHDTTIGAFQVFNELTFGTKVDYARFAENCFYELYTKADNKYYVRYINGDVIKFDISYDDFKSKIQAKIYTDEQINDFCDFNGDNWKKGFIISTFILVGVVVLLIVLLVIGIMRRKKSVNAMVSEISPEPLVDNHV